MSERVCFREPVPSDQEDGGATGGEEFWITRFIKIAWALRPTGTAGASEASTLSAPAQPQQFPERKQSFQVQPSAQEKCVSEAQARILQLSQDQLSCDNHQLCGNKPLRSDQRAGDAEVMNRALQHENDLLRFQLNDLICREKNQRLEIQRLRAHRDVEVTAMVQESTQKMQGEIEQLKGLLEPTSAQLVQALSEKEKSANERDQALAEIEKLKKQLGEEEANTGARLRKIEEVLNKSTAAASNINQSVEAFQKHVLPTFRAAPQDIHRHRHASCEDGSHVKLLDELQKLEAGITLLRVIVDAKNDTLVLIRGKLKQENEELRAELVVAREQSTTMKQTVAAMNVPTGECATTANEEIGFERNLLRQEFRTLQELYDTNVKQLKTKLKQYEQEETLHQTRFAEVQHDCQALQAKLTTIEASRHQLEESLKDETTARSQLVSQLFQMRKENERLKAELEMLKLNQKFLVRQPRRGRLPMEKMDLINTVNQLLTENTKLKGDKVALEEEVKTQRRSNVLERVKSSVTARDVALCASNKVGDGELASKLARVRLQQLGDGSPKAAHLALTNGSPTLSMAMINPYLQSDTPRITMQNSPSFADAPTRDDSSRPRFGQSPKMLGIMNLSEAGRTGLAQLAGLRERGIIGGSSLS